MSPRTQAPPAPPLSLRAETPEYEHDPVALASIAGDRAALAQLWENNRRWVAAILLAHKPRWADLDDLLQEVAVSLVRKSGEVRDPNAFKPWLKTVAVNVALVAARKGKRHTGHASLHLTSEPSEDGTSDSPARGADFNDPLRTEGQRLLQLAAELDDGYREPLLMKAVHGMSYREIGRVLGLPETTIETRIARARRQLRDLAKRDSDLKDTV